MKMKCCKVHLLEGVDDLLEAGVREALPHGLLRFRLDRLQRALPRARRLLHGVGRGKQLSPLLDAPLTAFTVSGGNSMELSLCRVLFGPHSVPFLRLLTENSIQFKSSCVLSNGLSGPVFRSFLNPIELPLRRTPAASASSCSRGRTTFTCISSLFGFVFDLAVFIRDCINYES